MSAIHQLITNHIDIWTAADTEKKSGRGRSSGNSASAYGVKKLRELILELAVRGKLVPQDPKDEPASELLKKIQAEKTKLIEEGKAKKRKSEPSRSNDQNLPDPPKGWSWTSLEEVALINPRNDAPSEIEASFIPMNLIGTTFNGSHEQEIRSWGEIKQGFTHFSESDIGVAKITPCFENSKACVFTNLKNGIGAGTTELHIVRPIAGTLDPRYVLAYLKSPEFLIVGETRMTGTAGQKRLPKDFLGENPFPLPPLAEQHRIVAKVDELMALCDQLETQHNNAAAAHEKLVSQLLATLTQSKNAEEFSENWQRIAAHFDTLFTTEASIDALKQTLLQLAVMGKLVPQDPNDDPASELLKKIQAEKAKLITEGKIKKEKSRPAINESETPFNLPAGWVWKKLGNVFSFEYGDNLPAEKRSNTGEFPVYGSNGVVGSHNICFVNSPCIVIGRKGSAGALNLCLAKGCCVTDVAYYCVPPNSLDLIFSFKLFHTLGLDDLGKGIKPGLGRNEAYELPIAIPPLAEQHRIVAKVDELMALCDQLKSRITEANRLQQKLADAVVEQALSSEFQAEEAEVPSRDEARALLGAEIIHQLHTEKTFGQVKLQKIVHLSEYIAELQAVAGEYRRYARGPHDPEIISDIELAIKQKEWYEEHPREKVGHAYRPLPNAGAHRKKMGVYWQEKLPIIQKLIDVMRKWDTERCEIFSTLYAAWNDLLIFGKPVSDEAILSEVLERWNDSKTKIPRKNWLEGLEWMRKEGFIPKGTGRATRAEGLFD